MLSVFLNCWLTKFLIKEFQGMFMYVEPLGMYR